MSLTNSLYRLAELNSMIDMVTTKLEHVADRLTGAYPKPTEATKAQPKSDGVALGIDDEIQIAFRRVTELNDQVIRLDEAVGNNNTEATLSAHAR